MSHPLKEYRKLHGKTLAEIADIMGVQKAAVSKWEHGRGPRPLLAIEIEAQTGGAIPRWILRPDLWAAPHEAAQ